MDGEAAQAALAFAIERVRFALEQRGFARRGRARSDAGRRRRVRCARAAIAEAIQGMRASEDFQALARAVQAGQEHREGADATTRRSTVTALAEPAERALLDALDRGGRRIEAAVGAERLSRAPSSKSPAFARPSTGSLPRCS